MYQEIKTKFGTWTNFGPNTMSPPVTAAKSADGRRVFRPLQESRMIDWLVLNDGTKIFIEQWGDFLIAANIYSRLTRKGRPVYNDQPFNVRQSMHNGMIQYTYCIDGTNVNNRALLRDANTLERYHPWTQLLEPEEARWPVVERKSDNP